MYLAAPAVHFSENTNLDFGFRSQPKRIQKNGSGRAFGELYVSAYVYYQRFGLLILGLL